ncbi:MAG: metal ABC transporter permease [Bacteroidia bacterium]|nr:metal ABC transporter permease [Bacteroidia bacterium]
MDMLIDFFQYPFAIRALLASSMVGLMCGVLGTFIVLRNMALIGDALSHAILPGVVVGFLVAGYSIIGFFAGSVIAGLIAAILITWIQRNVSTQEDAAIGIVFTSMFALGVMGISYLTHQQGVHLDLKDFLFGNVLGIGDQDLWLTFSVMTFTILCVAAFYRFLFITTFESVVAKTLGFSVGTIHYFLMLLLSFAVVASLQSVGVILVVAMLITPASTAYLLTQRLKNMIWISGAVGLLSAVLGLFVAVWLETTPGPAMTVMASLIYLLAVLFSPQKGLLSKMWRMQRKRLRIYREDILKQALRLYEKQALTFENLLEKMDANKAKLRWQLRKLVRMGLLQGQGNELILTESGLKAGYQLVRAHRLWETYLVEKVGLNQDQIHAEAEDLEHLLPEDFLEEVSKTLGNPARDPHGSPIPGPEMDSTFVLTDLQVDESARISFMQLDHWVRSQLWELELSPGEEVQVKHVLPEGIDILAEGRAFSIPSELALLIKIDRVGEKRL